MDFFLGHLMAEVLEDFISPSTLFLSLFLSLSPTLALPCSCLTDKHCHSLLSPKERLTGWLLFRQLVPPQGWTTDQRALRGQTRALRGPEL